VGAAVDLNLTLHAPWGYPNKMTDQAREQINLPPGVPGYPLEVNLLPGDTLVITDIKCPFELTTPEKSLRVATVVGGHRFVVIDATQYADLVLCRKYMSKSWWTRLRRKSPI
jgi:hypothetical protein